MVKSRSVLYIGAIFLVLVVVSLVAIYALIRDDDKQPSTPASDLAVPLPATNPPPVEAPQEVELQQQVRDWMLTMEGVTHISTLDIDVPDDAPPLVYAELEVASGHNNQSIPNLLIAKVNEVLNVTQYSDFVVIINDGTQTIEYALNLATNTWNETVLSDSVSDAS